MPAKAAGKKGKKEEAKPAPSNYDQITVRECLVWDAGKKRRAGATGSDNKENQNEEDTRKAHFRPVKGVLGKPVDRGYEFPEEEHQAHPDESGTAGEALRGWPRQRREMEEEEAEAFRLKQEQQQQQACNKGKKGGKSKKNSKDEEAEEKSDPWMGDLMSHRFLNDYVRQKEAEDEKERQKQEAKDKSAATPAWKKKTDIKANRTSQLRAIAAAQKVDIDPKDLWQMSKFKNNAQPSLTTFRGGNKSGEKEGKSQAGLIRGGEVAPVCTCPDETLSNHDGRAYYEDEDLEDRYGRQPAYDTARDAEY